MNAPSRRRSVRRRSRASEPFEGEEKIWREIGRRIAAFRKERGLTVRQLSKRIGLSEGQLSRLENGHQGLRSRVLLRIAQVLGVKPVQFFMFAGEEDKEVSELTISASLRSALREPGFVALAEDLAASYHKAPLRFGAVKSVASVLLEGELEEPATPARRGSEKKRRKNRTVKTP